MQCMIEDLKKDCISLLIQLIETPSLSKKEEGTAELLIDFLQKKKLYPKRHLNNVYCFSSNFDPSKPTILMASHHDTVPPSAQYMRDPYKASVQGDLLYGLGANDAGGCLVAYIATFIILSQNNNLSFNLILAATAEEEISGCNGIAALLQVLPKVDFAMMGEPTSMDLAIAEKGLIVVDCISRGKAGHAARLEGVNAIYQAMDEIKWIKDYSFEKQSDLLGSVRMSVTQIQAGQKHNMTPDECHYVIDIRSTEIYSNEEIVDVLRENLKSEVKPRSLRLQPSFTPKNHPFVESALSEGCQIYGSDTLSDQALCHGFPTVKIAPGVSARSHSADEFVKISEVYDGIEKLTKIMLKFSGSLR